MGDPKEKQIRQYYIQQGYEGQALDDAVNYAIEYQAKQTKQTEPKKQTVEPPVAKGGNNQISNIKVNPENKDEAFVEFSAPAIKPPPELVNKDLPDIKERELFYTKGLQQKGFKGEDLQKRLDFALNRDRDRYNKKLEAYEKQVKDSQPKPVVNKNKGGWGDETDDWALTSMAKSLWNNALIPVINNLGSIPEVAVNFAKTGYNLQKALTDSAADQNNPGIVVAKNINKAIDAVLPYIKNETDAIQKGLAIIGKEWNELLEPITETFEFDINPAAQGVPFKPAKGYDEDSFSMLKWDSWEADSFGKWAGSVGQGLGSTASIFLASGAAKLFSKGKVSPALAAYMTGSLVETNGIMQNLMENHDMSREEAMAIASFAGPIIGTVDVLFGIENIAAKGFFRELVSDEILKVMGSYATKKLTASQFKEIGKAIGKKVAKKKAAIALNILAQTGVEGVTEGSQSGIENAIYQLVDNYLGYEKKTGQKLFDKVMSGDSLTGFELNAKTYVDMINEGAIGGLAGGITSTLVTLVMPSQQQTLFGYIESQVRSGKDPRTRMEQMINDPRAGLDEQEKAYARENMQEMYNVAEAFKGVKGTADGKFQMYSLAKEKIHLQNKINEFQAREQELAGRISELEELTNNPPVPPTMEDVATYQAQNAAAVAELAQRQAEYEQHIAKADDVKQYSENIALIDDTAKKVAKAGTVDITYETNKKALEEKYKKASTEPADSTATPAEEKVKKKSKPAWKDGRKEGYMRSRMADLTDENGKRKAHIKDDDGDWFAVIRKPGSVGNLDYALVEDAPTIKALNDIFGEGTVVPVETPPTVETEPIITPPPAPVETPVAPTVEPIVTPPPAPAKPKTKYSKLKDVVLKEGETHAITFLDEGGESTDKSITVKKKVGNQYIVEDETGKEFLVQANDLQNDIFEQDQSAVSADFGAKYTPTKTKAAPGKKEEAKVEEGKDLDSDAILKELKKIAGEKVFENAETEGQIENSVIFLKEYSNDQKVIDLAGKWLRAIKGKKTGKPKEETPEPKAEETKAKSEKPKVEETKSEQKKSDPVSTNFVTARSKDNKSLHYLDLVKHSDGTYSIVDKEQMIKGEGFKSMQEVEQYFDTIFSAFEITESQDLIPLEQPASLNSKGLSFLDKIKKYRDFINEKYLGYIHDMVNDTYYKIYEQDTTKSRKEYKSDQYKGVKVNGKIYLRKVHSYNVSAGTGNGTLDKFNENKTQFDILNSDTANKVFDLLNRVGIEILGKQSEEFESFKHDIYGLDNLYRFIESIEKKQYNGEKNQQEIERLYELNKEETPTPKEETKAPAAEKTKDDEKTIENIPLDTNITLDEFDGLGIFNSSVFGQLIYKAILNVANQFDIKIKFSNSTSELSEGAAAHFDSVSGTVLINLQNLYESYQNTLNNKGRAKGTMLGVKGITSFSDFINYTITHELIHGVTQAAYVDVFTNTRKGKYSGKLSSVQVDAIKAIGGIFNYLKSLDSQQYFGGIEYGLHNMSELMAEMSNEGFVSALQRIELPENLRYNSKSKNVFESIISFVRDFFAGKKVENNAAQSLYSAISDIITSPQTQNFTESNSEPTEQTQEEKIRTKIAEKKARLKKLNDERNTLKIADDPKRNAEMDIEMLSVATEMIGDYIELGKIKFKDIVNDIIAEDGRTFAEQLFNYIKKAYAAYYTSATDDIADQMDDPKSVRGSKFEDFAEITEPDVVDKAEPIKEQPKQVNTNSGIEKVLNKLRGKVDEQVGNAKTTLSEFEAKALEQEISKLEEKAVSEGGASFNEAEPQNFNYEKIDGKEQKINVYEADGYKIEYGYSRQGWISITTPSGEVLRIIDKKYKNERGRDVVYYAQLKDETRPKTEKPKTVKSAIPTVGEKNEDGEYAYNAPFHEAVDNNTGDVIVGTKEYNMPLADGDTIQYTHVVADAALILPSHDPSGHIGIGATGTGENGNLNVASLDLTEGYPERDGKSANSREYNTKSVIEAMFEHAYDLITEFLLGSPTSSNGEPVITDDGVVISGNSRTMSLWVAIERNKDKKTKVKIKGALRGVDGNYDRYLAALKEEIAGSPAKYAGITVEQIDDMVARGKHPILVKKSSNIKEYSKTEFDRYNQDLTQSKTEEERAKTAKDAIDSATPEQKQQLADLFYMVDDNGITSSIKDILSSKNRAQKIADLLSSMGLLSKADYAKYLHNGIFNNAGIEHVTSVLRGIVLSDETLEIFLDAKVEDEFGLKHFVKNIERALPALLYNYLIEGDANVVDWLIAAVQLKTYHYNQGATDNYISVPKKRGVEQKDNIDGFVDMRIRQAQSFPTGDANDTFFGLMENEANRLFVTAFFAAANAATRAFASTDLTKLVQAFNNEHRRSVGEKILEETANIFSDTNEDIVRKDALNAIETLVATYYPQLLLSKIADPNISEQEKAELQKQADIHNKKIIANIYDNLIKQGLSIDALEKFARDTFGGKSDSGTTEPIGTKGQKDNKGQETTDTGNAGDTNAGTNQSGKSESTKTGKGDQADPDSQGREPKSGVGVGETEVAGTDSTEQTDPNAETGATENQEKSAEIEEQTTPPTHRVSEEKAVADNKKARAYNGDTLNGLLYSFEEEMRVAAASNEAVKKEKLKAKTSLGVVEISYDKTKDRLAYKKEDGTPLTPNEIETLFVEIVQGKSALTDDSGTTVFAPKETVSNNEAQAQYRAEVRDALKKDKGVSKDIADDTISVESVYKMADQAGVMPADLHKNIKQAILDKTGYTAETYSEILKKPTDGQEKKTDSSKQELRDESKPTSGGAVRGNPSRRVHSERPPIVYAAPNQIPTPEEQIKDNEYTYLDEHQRFGVNLILTRFAKKARGFFLADGPGVGKTAILLAVAHVMSKRGKVLIVTQSKDIINDSFKDDAIGLGIDPKKSGITITTYNDIKTLNEDGSMKFSNTEFVLVIYDESHKLKNSHTGNAIASFNIKSDHILFSSATPMDKPTGAVYFMSQILGLSEEDIYNRLGLQVSTYRDKDGVSKKKVTLLKGTSPQQVAKRLQGLALTAIREGAMLRREFPFWGTIEEVALIPDNIAEILAEEAEIKSYWEGRPRTAGQMLNELRRWNESKKVEAIWQLVMEELAAGRKVVVFANFYTQSLIKGLGREVPMFITLFTEKAEKMGIPIAKLWSAHDVTIEREKFQNGEVSIALGTFGSAATGVQADDRFGNEPRTLILVTPPYAGDLMQQAIGRVSRKLSQSAAKAIVVYVPGTSDSHAMGIMKKKIMTLEAMQKAGAELEALSVADDFLSEVEGTEPEAGSTELVKDAAKINDLNTKQLDEDNFLVYGTGTYHNRHAIKALGGRFNGNQKGWVFPLSQRAQIERELGIKEEAKFQIAPERGRSYSPVTGSGRGKEGDVEAMAKRKAKEGETVAAMKPEEREKYMVKRKAKVLKMAAFLNKVFPKIKLRIVSKAEFYAKFKAEIDAGRVKLDNIAGVKLGDEVWLNIDAMVTNELTAVHEFAHVFTAIMKEYMNKTYMKGLALVAGTVYHQYALATHSGVYKTPEDYLEEALVLAIEDMGAQILSRTLYIRFVDWARSILNRIGRRVGFVKGLSLADMSLNDFTRLIAERMLSGSEISLKEDVSDEIYAQMQIFGEPIEAPDIVAKRSGGILSNPRFSYIGAANIFSNKSKEVIKNAYKMALSMMANGKTSEEIRVATGWFRNPYDKKWRYEIGDREMSFKNDEESLLKISQATEANPLKLSDVINHDKLFALFPELKDIYIIYKQGDTNYHASMRSDGNRITVALPFFSVTTGQQLAILLHEVQHSIQIREGLAMGASPEQMTDILANLVSARAKALQPLLRHTEYPLAFVRIGEYYNALKEILGNKEAEAIFEKTYRTTVQAEINSIEDKINGYDSAGIVDYQGRSAREYLGKKGQFYSLETRRAVKNRLQYADVFMDNENLNRKYRLVSTGAPLSSIRDMYYMATAGEIEARDVEARMFMTDKQRQDTPPYSTEDYQSDEAITYFGTDEDADFAEDLVGFRPQIIPALKDVESTAKALEDSVLKEDQMALAVTAMQKGGTINYKDIKKSTTSSNYETYINRPDLLDDKSKKIYNELYAGGKLRNKKILLDNNGKLIDGTHRFKALLAMGQTDFDYAVPSDNFFTQPYTRTISEAYHKAKKDGSNPELVKAVEDLLGTQDPPKFSITPTEIKAQAIANGTFMKAPNGKPTNLNERQWLQVRTPEFKAWFGDWESDPKNASKVVDANGEPLVVYHGTSETFNEFNTKRGSSGLGGIYFTPKKEKTAIHGENVMSVFLNLRNPLDISKKSMFLPFEGQIEIDKKNGNDGYVNIRPHEEEYIAFEPNQIKSATDNTGTFSPDTNDIRFSITPTTTPAGTSTARFSIPNGVEISEYHGAQERNAYHGALSTMNHASIIAQMRTDLDDYVQAYITNNIGSATKMKMLANFYDDPIMLEVAQTITDPFFTPSKEAADLYKFIFDSDPDTPSQNLFGAINKYRLEENYSFLGVHEKIDHAADVTDVANQQQALNNAKSGVTKFILNRRKFLIAGQKFGKYLQQQMIDLFNFTTVSKWFSTATGTLAKFDQLIKARNLIAGKLKARNNQLFELAVNEFSHMTAYRGVNNYTSVKKIEVLNARDGKLYKMPVDYVISLIQMHESFVDHWARQGKNKVSPLIDSTSSGETDGFVFQDFDDPTIQRILRLDDAEYLRLQDEINNTPEYSAMYHRVETLFNRNDIFDYLSQTYSHNTGLKLPRVAKYFPLTAITDTNAEMDLRNITGLLEETSIIKPRTGPARQYRLMGAMSAMKAHYETVEDFVQNQEVILNISNYLNKNEKVLKADKYNQPELIEYLTNFMKDLNNWRRQVYEQNKDQQKVINIPKMLSKFALSRFAWNFGMPLIQAFGYFPALMQGVVKDKYLLLAGKDLSYLITRAYTDSLLLAGEKEKLPILPLSTGEAKLMDEIRHNVFASELYLRLHQTNPDVDLTPLTEINPRSASTIAGAAMQSWNWLINTVADKYGMSFMRRGDRAPILTFYKAAQYQFDAESVGGMLDGMNRDKWVADKATKLMYLTNQLYPMNQRTGFQRRKDILSKMVGLFSGQQQKQLNLALQSYADYLVTPTTENKWRLTGAIGFGIIFSAFGTAFVHALFKGLRDSIKPGDDDDDDEKQGEMLFDYFRTDLIRNLTGNVPGIPTELFNTFITYIDKQYWTDKPADIPPLSSLTELMEGLGEMHNGMTMDADGSIKSEYEQAKSIHRGLVMINRNAAQLLGIPFEFARQFENTVLYSIKPEKPKAKSKKAF